MDDRLPGDGAAGDALQVAGVSPTPRLLDSSASRLVPSPITHHPSPAFVSYAGLIIDDIVLPDGRTYFDTLGGASTHALVGMRVWSDCLGYFAAVGADFAPRHREMLQEMGVDLRGLLVREDVPTARAWQLFDTDERRVEVFRTSLEVFYEREVRCAEMPADYLQARGYHLSHGSLGDAIDLFNYLRSVNPNARIVWEPTPLQQEGDASACRAALGLVDAFSPDEGEARQITGQAETEKMMDTLLGWGAPIVALRQGARGSQIATRDGARYAVPAIPITVVDTTGAGNAYAGGLLIGLCDDGDLIEAAAKAAVSASFAIEQFGVPRFDERTREEAQRRLAWVRERITVGDG